MLNYCFVIILISMHVSDVRQLALFTFLSQPLKWYLHMPYIVHVYLINNLPTLLHFYNFSFFLEKNMLSFFLRYLQQKSGRFICVQLLQTLNILFENIRNETSLCKPFHIYHVHLFYFTVSCTFVCVFINFDSYN